MKRRKTLTILATLTLIVALATTGLVSGTFAKYIGGITGADTARVAKFGFVFNNVEYSTSDTEVHTIDIFEVADSGVKLGVGENIIAPGTKGDFTLTTKNNSEVAIKIDFVFEEVNEAGIPIYYTYAGKNYSSLSQTEFMNTSVTPDGNLSDLASDLSSDYVLSHTGVTEDSDLLTWNWAFEDVNAVESDTTVDDYDTALGMSSPGPLVKLTISATATQLDEAP